MLLDSKWKEPLTIYSSRCVLDEWLMHENEKGMPEPQKQHWVLGTLKGWDMVLALPDYPGSVLFGLTAAPKGIPALFSGHLECSTVISMLYRDILCFSK